MISFRGGAFASKLVAEMETSFGKRLETSSGQGILVRDICRAQDDTTSPRLDPFNLWSLLDGETTVPYRSGILNDGSHIPNVHRYQVLHRNSKPLQSAKHVQSASATTLLKSIVLKGG